jgi:hypothetical protein
MSTLALGTTLEKRMGSLHLAATILVGILATGLLYVTIAYVAYAFLDVKSLMFQHSVGFSGILFQLCVLECELGPFQSRSLFGFVSVPPSLYPWVLLIVLQFVMPSLSLLGHFVGIVVGTFQIHGTLNLILPNEETLGELDSIVVERASYFSFVPTQNLCELYHPRRNGSSRALRAVGTTVYQLLEAAFVIVFGRGHRLNANTLLWQSSSTLHEAAETPSSVELSRLVLDEQESEVV